MMTRVQVFGDFFANETPDIVLLGYWLDFALENLVADCVFGLVNASH